MIQNSESRKRMNPRIPAGVLVQRIGFLLQAAHLAAGAGNNEAVSKLIGEAQEILAQLREVV